MTAQSLARSEPYPDLATPWWRGAVIYHIYPLSFNDSNGDGIGDLPGITAKLDHIKSLGVDGVWISPFYPSPMDDFGYDIAEYCDVDPRFGTLADFDTLVTRAHALGLKVLIDQVYCHTSHLHPWFSESRSSRDNPKADWYVWADPKPDGSPPTNWQSVFKAAAWTWDARRRQYYLNNFQAEQPDLNVRNPEVQEALLQVARFWLERGVDGFRLDAINFAMHDPELKDNPPVAGGGKGGRPFDFQHHFYNQSHPDILAFISRVRALADRYGAFLVAEVGGEQAEQEMKAYTAGSDRLHSAYGFDFLYANAISADLVQACNARWPGTKEEGWPAWAFSNHDAPRVVSRWGTKPDADALARQALLLLMSLRGSVFLYQGEELGLPQAHVPKEALRDPEAIANWPLTLGRDGARTPIPWQPEAPNAGFSTGTPWLPVDPAHIALAVTAQEARSDSLLQFTRSAIGLRQTYEALRSGPMRVIDAAEPMLAFLRGEGSQALLCAFNLGASPVAWSLPAGWEVVAGANLAPAPVVALPAHAGLVARRV